MDSSVIVSLISLVCFVTLTITDISIGLTSHVLLTEENLLFLLEILLSYIE